ncbi:MAG: SdpI family protein [Lachnospiraceae bacterium]|nr:SdpI family protein [Lachnospiraceae bacterium]
MFKVYRKTMVITSLLTVLPMLVGMALWNSLPEQMATNFGADGLPNGWSSRTFAVFGLPLLLLGLHWLCVVATLNDPKRRNVGGKMLSVIFWIIPLTSLFVCLSIYAYGLGWKVNISTLCLAMVGVLFLFLGNYLPKTRQNFTVGIKLPWTLSSEENWNRTHRLAGWLWMIGGVLILMCGFLTPSRMSGIFMTTIIVLGGVPVVYSFFLYKRGI